MERICPECKCEFGAICRHKCEMHALYDHDMDGRLEDRELVPPREA